LITFALAPLVFLAIALLATYLPAGQTGYAGGSGGGVAAVVGMLFGQRF